MEEYRVLDEKQIFETIERAKNMVAYGTISKNKLEIIEQLCLKITSLQNDIEYNKAKTKDEGILLKLTKLREELNYIHELMHEN